MSSVWRRRLAVAATLAAFFLSASARAAEPDVGRFKTEIDAFLGRLGPNSNGAVEWVGSDSYEVRRDGEVLLATIENARLSLNTPQPGQLIVDRIEIRETARKDEGKLIELALILPKNIVLREADGTETKISLTDARADIVIEAESGRGRDTLVEIASMRIDQSKTGTWVSLGPLSISSKLIAEPTGGWRGPVEFEVKGIEYFSRKVLSAERSIGSRSLAKVPVQGWTNSTSCGTRSTDCKLTTANHHKRAAPHSWGPSRQSRNLSAR